MATGLRIVDLRGRRPGILRSMLRLAEYCIENNPFVVAPAVVVLWLLADDALPTWTLPAAALLLLGAVVALLPALVSRGGRTLHDLAAGTTVVEE